jgi:sulfoxide reductase heme-binding subunit YedZ
MELSPATWYGMRASGIVAYVLVTGVVALGLVLSTNVRLRAWPKFAVEDVHRFVSILAGVFVGLHVGLVVVDTFMPFSPADVVVPFSASYRPAWTGLGTVAAELLLAVALTNAVRHRLSHRVWRGAHYLGFAVWLAATAHGLGAGTDRHEPWLLALYLLSVGAVLLGLVTRIGGRGVALAPAAVVSSLAACLVVGVLAMLPVPDAPAAGGAAASSVTRAFDGEFSGTVEQQEGAGRALMSVVGAAVGDGRALVRIDLLGDRAGIDDTSLQVVLPGSPTCTGTVDRIDAEGFSGACTTPDGTERSASGTWSVEGETVTGTLSVS